MRRQFFALTFVAFPLAVALSATFDDKAPTTAQGAKAAAPAGIEIDASGSQDRSLLRLLSVRLRRLDREEPGPSRSALVRPVRGAAGAQLHRAAPDSRSAGRRGRPQEGRRLLRRLHGRDDDRGRRSDDDCAGPRDHRRDSQPRRPPGSDRAPACVRRAGAVPLRRADRSRGCRQCDRQRRSGGPRPARSRLLPQDRSALGRSPREVRGADSEGADAVGRAGRASGPGRQGGAVDRDRARHRDARPREAARSRQRRSIG